MKNQGRFFGSLLVLGLFAAPAYAASEVAAPEVSIKSLVDFKAEYSGTKPIVAINKYWEYRALQMAPKPTLAEPRMRSEAASAPTGTKPVVVDLKRLEGR